MKHQTEQPASSHSSCSSNSARELSFWAIWGPLCVLILLYPFSQEIDMYASSYSYNLETSSFSPPSWCSVVYVWGLLPGQILFVAAILISLSGIFSYKLRQSCIWISSVYLFFVLSLGSGLIAHGIFKEYFTRPRPKQIYEFGGKYPYTEPLIPYTGQKSNPDDRLRSMPSGHATMGFYFLAFWFLGRRFSLRILSHFGIIVGFGLGLLLTISRVLEGGHFITDGIAACIIMWYTALVLDLVWRKA